MPATMKELGLDDLNIEERLALAQELWDSVELKMAELPMTDSQRVELERRLADSIARPDAVTPWETIKARALARAKG